MFRTLKSKCYIDLNNHTLIESKAVDPDNVVDPYNESYLPHDADTNGVGHNDAQEGQESNVVERFAAPKFGVVDPFEKVIYAMYYGYTVVRNLWS